MFRAIRSSGGATRESVRDFFSVERRAHASPLFGARLLSFSEAIYPDEPAAREYLHDVTMPGGVAVAVRVRSYDTDVKALVTDEVYKNPLLVDAALRVQHFDAIVAQKGERLQKLLRKLSLADYKTCPGCGSSIALRYVRENVCLVCKSTDFRLDHWDVLEDPLDEIAKYERLRAEAYQEYTDVYRHLVAELVRAKNASEGFYWIIGAKIEDGQGERLLEEMAEERGPGDEEQGAEEGARAAG